MPKKIHWRENQEKLCLNLWPTTVQRTWISLQWTLTKSISKSGGSLPLFFQWLRDFMKTVYWLAFYIFKRVLGKTVEKRLLFLFFALPFVKCSGDEKPEKKFSHKIPKYRSEFFQKNKVRAKLQCMVICNWLRVNWNNPGDFYRLAFVKCAL